LTNAGGDKLWAVYRLIRLDGQSLRTGCARASVSI
jgi:hypothetical protein